jgi:hypothetical protein
MADSEDNNFLAKGILLLTTIMTTCILTGLGILMKQFFGIFICILLQLGIMCGFWYLIETDNSLVKAMGGWLDRTMQKIKKMYTKEKEEED